MQDDESAISHTRLAYLPALDGVRACAVVAVMMFHGGIPHMDGGFMGVDAFFVLSGFLITSLLIGEWRQTLTIKLGAFWARRARRLLPALFLMLLFVAFLASVIVPQGHVRGAPARRAGHPALREQLALHSGQLELLQRDGGLLAAPAHLVAGGRGAVLRDLAAGRAGRPALHAEPAGPVRAVLCRGRRVGDLDVRALRRRPQHEPGLPGHRHPVAVPVHRVRARRRARPAHAAQPRGGPPGQGRAVAARGRHRAGALRRDRRRRRGRRGRRSGC